MNISLITTVATDNITAICDDFLHGNNSTSSELLFSLATNSSSLDGNITQFCLDYKIHYPRSVNSGPISPNPKMKTFYMQAYADRTTSFYGDYDPQIGLRIAGVLGSFLLSLILYTLYKTKCKRDRWSHDDKQFIERYSKVLADKWSGKVPKVVNKGGIKTKPSVDETAKWICSQPLQEVSLLSKWTIQDTMYNICLESFKATACPVTEFNPSRSKSNQPNNALDTMGKSGESPDNQQLHLKNDNGSESFVPNGFSTPLLQDESAKQQCSSNWDKKVNEVTNISKECVLDDFNHDKITLLNSDNQSLFLNPKHLYELKDMTQNNTEKSNSKYKKQMDTDTDEEPNLDIFSPVTLESNIDFLSPVNQEAVVQNSLMIPPSCDSLTKIDNTKDPDLHNFLTFKPEQHSPNANNQKRDFPVGINDNANNVDRNSDSIATNSCSLHTVDNNSNRQISKPVELDGANQGKNRCNNNQISTTKLKNDISTCRKNSIHPETILENSFENEGVEQGDNTDTIDNSSGEAKSNTDNNDSTYTEC